jgi:hypothetical protein
VEFFFKSANFSLACYAFIQTQLAPASRSQKLRVLEGVKKLPIWSTLNFAIHRQNIGELEELLGIVKSVCSQPR